MKDTAIAWGLPLAFGLALCIVAPLGSALQFGSDEGFELMKAFLVSQGHPLYTEIWNDQPPFHTEIVAALFRLFGPSAGAARLLSVVFAVVYLSSIYGLAASRSGRVAGLLAVLLAGASPVFIRLSVSVMLELPAMALALASLWMLLKYCDTGSRGWLLLSGLLFGCALQVKFTAAIFVPALAAQFHMEARAARFESAQATSTPERPRTIAAVLLWSVVVFAVVAAVQLTLYPLNSLPDLLRSHFSSETRHSAAAELYAFSPASLLDNPLLLPTGAGLACLVYGHRRDLAVPTMLLGTVLAVHLCYRPYWFYYELHFVAPMAWFAAVGIVEWFRVLMRQQWSRSLLAKLRLTLAALAWSTLLAPGLSALPHQMWDAFASLAAALPADQDERVVALLANRANTRWVFTDQLICAFSARLPVPPELAVIPFKRIWSGQISPREVRTCLERYRPEQILLRSEWQKSFRLSEYLRDNYTPGTIEGLYVRKEAVKPQALNPQ